MNKLGAYARKSDPETSYDAAESMIPHAAKLEKEVLDCLLEFGPQTIDELCSRLERDKVTLSPRLRPLCNKGFVKPNGKRPGKSGRGQTIWEPLSDS